MQQQHSTPLILKEIEDLRNLGVCRLVTEALLAGLGTGAVIGLFRYLYILINEHLTRIVSAHVLDSFALGGCVFAVLILMALVSGWVVTKEPLLSGSGIPQVELVLRGRLPFPWVRLLFGKFIATLISLSGGLSVGREGPCIQMGAAVGCGVSTLCFRSGPTPHMLVAGSAAGMTAAFGAPLAGLLFAFEEMKTILSVPLLLFTTGAVIASWFVVHIVFGFGLVFPFLHLEPLSLPQYALLPPLGLAIGLLGALYNSALMKAFHIWDSQRLFSPLIRPLFPFLCAGLLLYVYPSVLVGFGIPVSGLEDNPVLSVLLPLLIIKVLFTILSFSSGVSGGLLMPMLGIGALLGSVFGNLSLQFDLLSLPQLGTVLALSMAGMFAATVRAPLTGAFLVLEMTAAWNSAPALLLVAFCASFTANHLHSSPIYDSIKARILRRAGGQGTPPAARGSAP